MKKVSYSPVFSCGEGGEEVGESQIMTGKRWKIDLCHSKFKSPFLQYLRVTLRALKFYSGTKQQINCQ